jgi:hypothetical protein
VNNSNGADVAGPVLKNCTKDFTDVPSTNEIKI